MQMIRTAILLLCLTAASGYAAEGNGKYKELYRKGVECNKKGEFAEAIKYYSRAITLKADSADLYFVRGRAYKQNREFDNAISDLTRAIALRPGYADAYNHRAVSHIGKEDGERAKADFRKACELGSRDGCANLKIIQRTK